MPLPDANRTIAAALYGACVALCQPKQSKQAEEPQEGEKASPASPAPGIPPSWNQATVEWRNAMVKGSSFLNSYCHGISVGSIDRARAGEALVDCLRETEVAKAVKLPYAVMVEIFVSTKQALA